MSQQTRGARAASPDQQESASGVPAPQFLQPQPRRQDSAPPELTDLHPQEAEETRGHPDEEFSAGAADAPAQMAVDPSPASTGKKAGGLKPLVTESQMNGAKALVQTVLMGATTIVNRRTRVDSDDQRWIMEPEELDDIGTPFARMLARRSPIGADGEDMSDVGDLLEGVVGLIAYTMKQLLSDRPSPRRVQVEADAQQHPAPAGPGAMLSPLDPAYRVG